MKHDTTKYSVCWGFLHFPFSLGEGSYEYHSNEHIVIKATVNHIYDQHRRRSGYVTLHLSTPPRFSLSLPLF